jgi:hypothetical protein
MPIKGDILRHLKELEERGYDKDQLFVQLRKKGYSHHDIDQAYKEHQKSLPKKEHPKINLHKEQSNYRSRPALKYYTFISRPTMYLVFATIFLIILIYILFYLYFSR